MVFDPSAVRSGSIFSTNPNYLGAWVCYINGVEVPIIGFEVQYGVWQIPSFTIHLIPDILLQRLGNEDRVPVQLFYLDQWFDPEHPEFRLLVDGEIIGWQFTSSAGQRTMSFSCLSHIHVFQQLYFFYMTNVDDIVAAQAPEIAANGFTTPGLLYPYSLFHQGLLVLPPEVNAARPPPPRRPGATTQLNVPSTEPATTPTTIKAPYELVYNIIKGLISKDVPNTRRAVPMMNFFARHVRKTRLHNRFVRLPFLEDPDVLDARKGVFPIFNAAKNDEALNAMQRQVSAQVGESGPVWNLLQQTLSMVFMEIGMVPNPAAVVVALNDGGVTSPRDGMILNVVDARTPLTEQPISPNSDEVVAQAEATAANLRAVVRGAALLVPDLPQASAPTSDAGINTQRIQEGIAQRENQRIGIGPNSPPRVETVTPTTPVRLAQYFVKPQFLFGVPPHCNVIFPSQVRSWTYDEPFLTQPTRIYVNDSVMTSALRASGPNRHFMLHSLTVGFPEEADALMEHKAGGDTAATTVATQGASPASLESGKNLLIWPEEYYKGPVTEKLALPSWFQMLRQFSNSNPGGVTPAAGAPATTSAQPGASPSPTPSAVSGLPRPPIPGPVVVPPTVSNLRRGEAGWRTQATESFAYRWRARPEAIAAGDRNTVRFNRQPLLHTLIPNANGHYQYVPASALTILTEFLLQLFPNAFRRGEMHRPSNRQPAVLPPGSDDATKAAFNARYADIHIAGRAVDLICKRTLHIGRLYSLPDLENVSPVADYLIQNADVLGVQSIVWARSEWTTRSKDRRHPETPCPPGERFQHFTTSPESEAMDHFDHIHVELNLQASEHPETMAFYTTNQALLLQPSRPQRQRQVRHGQTTVSATSPAARRIPAFIAPRPQHAATVTNPVQTALPGSNNGATPPAPVVAAQPAPPVPGHPAPGQGTPQPPATNTTPAPTAAAVDTEVQADSFQKLFRLYAQYEYLRRRYSVRQAGLQMRFNPYLVAGFPSMMFDSMATRFHLVGYIQTVAHSASAAGQGSIGTTVQMTCCRTLPEFINDVRADAERFRSRVTSAPAEIIDEIRSRIQDDDNAEAFYRRLFYGDGPRPGNAPTAFRWTEAMAYTRPNGQSDDIVIQGDTVAASVAREEAIQDAGTENTPERQAAVAAQDAQTVTHNLDPNRELSPRENIYQDAFDSYDLAMQLASRPACTLEQYIRFWHGGMTVGDLLLRQVVTGPQDNFAMAAVDTIDVLSNEDSTNGQVINTRGPTTRKSATYYDRIFKLREGPGTGPDHLDGPSVEERGYTDPPAIRPSDTHAGVAANYPQTRANWDSVLEAYRDKVRTLLRPST